MSVYTVEMSTPVALRLNTGVWSHQYFQAHLNQRKGLLIVSYQESLNRGTSTHISATVTISKGLLRFAKARVNGLRSRKEKRGFRGNEFRYQDYTVGVVWVEVSPSLRRVTLEQDGQRVDVMVEDLFNLHTLFTDVYHMC